MMPDFEAVSDVSTDEVSMKPFMALWSGQAISIFGTRLVRFAIVWWITLQTGSATVLALVSIAALVPQVIISPFAGSYVDKWNRKRVMAASDSLVALSIAFLAFLFFTGAVQIWHILAVMVFGASVGSFQYPAMAATTTLMVPKRHLARVGGMNQTLNGLASILAPPMGAILLALIPMGSILAIDVVTAIIAVSVVLLLDIPQPKMTDRQKEQSVLANLVDGMRYVAGWRAMSMIVVVAMMINFVISPAFTLLPILVAVNYLGDQNTLAIVQSTLSVGMVLGGILLSIWGGGERKLVSAMGILTTAGGAMILISMAPASQFVYILFLFFSVGFLIAMVNALLSATFQGVVPPEIQGRVFALTGSLATAMTPVGLVLAGPLADLFGVPFWFMIGGLVTVAMSLAGLASPAIRTIESSSGESAREEEASALEEIELAQASEFERE
jgi:DHA3 family macrolide efflux protein-like MFS transporter